ncbi:MAG: glutamate-5-semialdehyde dehydrogenase [Lachnospiraceae bacterium]|nr:glutamate-5-semialdehyde dehydrogenase [Lachnospiraceae bacterium]
MSIIHEQAKVMKSLSPMIANLSLEVRNQILLAIHDALINNKERIFEANELDLKKAREDKLDDPVIKRLKFSEEKLKDVTGGLKGLIKLPDPLYVTSLERELSEGLKLVRKTCAIGVIGVIFESRPDALIQIAGLCIKSGNAAILKGGSEAYNSNKVIFEIMNEAAVKAGLPEGGIFLASTRSEIADLLECNEYVDLLIPRGSNAFVQYIMNNTQIPVMGHADGICHVYADKDADIDLAVKVIVDSKTQYVSVCNATETLLVHKDISKELLPILNEELLKKNVTVVGSREVMDIISCEEASEEDWKTEYLDYKISIKLVGSVDEAIEHINKYGSHHTDCIVTKCDETADHFMRYVDSAGVYRNCSTRFADGFRYGFGAEVGVSTGKLHARGPVGLEGLVTYKYMLTGDGHIVADFAEGKKTFIHDR